MKGLSKIWYIHTMECDDGIHIIFKGKFNNLKNLFLVKM